MASPTILHGYTCIFLKTDQPFLLHVHVLCVQYVQRVMHFVLTCVTKNIRLHTYWSSIFAKRYLPLVAYHSLMSPKMFARCELYREYYFQHFYPHDILPGFVRALSKVTVNSPLTVLSVHRVCILFTLTNDV